MGGGSSVPDKIDVETCKKLAGDKFDQAKFDALEKDAEGKVSREQFLALAEALGLAHKTNQELTDMASPKICIIYYTMYGHMKAMVDAVKSGAEEAGAQVTVYQVEETLPEEVLEAMGAPPKPEDPVITREDIGKLDEFDGFFFGLPTRFGKMPAQMCAFFDSLGQLWQGGKLNGKAASMFCSTGTQGGGVETTIYTSLTTIMHLGMVYVPVGYTCPEVQFDMSELHGGSSWGAHAYAGPDGSRAVSEKELKLCKHQGTYCTGIMKKLCA